MRWNAIVKDGMLTLEGSSYEESGAEIIVESNGNCKLYEITQYGSATLFYNNYTNINEAIQMAESWT